ncbi:MAG: ABC transporter substrate-binding protein [Rhodospirillales bacterium]
MRAIGLQSIVVLLIALTASPGVHAAPQRIASLNVCVGQLALALAGRARMASMTFLATDPESAYWHKEARGLPVNYGRAEEIMSVRPDLVIAGRYTTSATTALLQKLGYRVELFDPAESLEQLRVNIRRMAAVVGEPARGARLIRDMDRRLAAAASAATPEGQKPVAVIFRANGFTMGRRSLINDVLTLTGFSHLSAKLAMEQAGFLPLEKLIAADPALIVFSEFKPEHPSIAHQLLEHPALEYLLSSRWAGGKRSVAVIPASLWNCGGPFIADAAERLARERALLVKAGGSP